MINKVTATGSVVAIKKFGAASGRITIAQKINYRIRKDGHGENAVRDDYLIFQYNASSNIKDVIDTLRTGDHVEIEGHVNSYLKRNEDGSTKECVNLYLDSIKPEETEFYKTFGIPGGHYPQDANALCIEGKIEALVMRGSMINLRLNASDENKTNLITLMAGNRFVNEVKRFSIGDRVYIGAMIKTQPITEQSDRRDYNQFTITAIAKAK